VDGSHAAISIRCSGTMSLVPALELSTLDNLSSQQADILGEASGCESPVSQLSLWFSYNLRLNLLRGDGP